MYPLNAYWRDVNRSAITFDECQSATKVPFKLPCGKCIGCRMEKARQWGVRCLHEKKMWPQNSYVTLTYSDEYLPPGGSLSLRDLQLFMKRLRKGKNSSKDNPLRFFAGAEYGEENLRPHYHLLLFNCGFKDQVFHTYNKRGEPLFTSKELDGYWNNMGFCTIGDVTFDSAVYCAKYALKKVNISERSTPEAKAEYERKYVVYDEDGVCYDRRPEFAVMSRRPGIGAMYYEKFGREVRDHDSVVINGRECKPPRFYDSRSEQKDASRMEVIKRERKRASVLNRADNTPERLRVKEKIMLIAAEKKERKL